MLKSKKTKLTMSFLVFVVCFSFAIFLLPYSVQAQGGLLGGVACIRDGSCGLCDVLSLVVGVAKIILGLVGGLALLMFILGGFKLVTAAGNQETITAGKKILTGAVIGLIIVLGAWQAVFITISILSKGNTEASSYFGVATPKGFAEALDKCGK